MSVNLRLPYINGRTEKEQLAQMKNYLHQLVGDLQYALDDATGSHNESAYLIGNASFNDANKDYVIEERKRDGWTYKKWKSGTYEMFGIFEVKPGNFSLHNALYMSDPISIELPFNTTSACVSGCVDGFYCLTSGGVSNEGRLVFRMLGDEATNSDSSIAVQLHVVGTYV